MMMTKPHVQISVVTRREMTSWDFGCQFLHSLCSVDERLRPEIISNREPHEHPFVSLEACEKFWSPVMVLRGELGRVEVHSDFLWRCSKAVECSGTIFQTRTDKYGKLHPGQVLLRAHPDGTVDWLALFRAVCNLAQPKYGILHLLTELELPEAELNSPAFLFKRGPPGWAVENSVPNLGWANFFGDEFAHVVDVARLQAQGCATERICDGHLITVTDSLFDVRDDFATFSARRALLKGQFAGEFFQIRDEPAHLRG
jgi:hypothetical protein